MSAGLRLAAFSRTRTSLVGSPFPYVLVAAVGTCVASIHQPFPGSRLFLIALANLPDFCACLFQFFVATNFRLVMPAILRSGLPFRASRSSQAAGAAETPSAPGWGAAGAR
jgi:hypothetical protein